MKRNHRDCLLDFLVIARNSMAVVALVVLLWLIIGPKGDIERYRTLAGLAVQYERTIVLSTALGAICLTAIFVALTIRRGLQSLRQTAKSLCAISRNRRR